MKDIESCFKFKMGRQQVKTWVKTPAEGRLRKIASGTLVAQGLQEGYVANIDLIDRGLKQVVEPICTDTS